MGNFVACAVLSGCKRANRLALRRQSRRFYLQLAVPAGLDCAITGCAVAARN
jgi:hypothetical protein